MTNSNMIRVWKFRDAPADLKKLSDNGGDEDWLALIPPDIGDILWMQSGTSFGCCDVSEYLAPDLPGYTVRIGCHS